MDFISSKLYYKIGEVCEIVGVEAYVLRYWETEFPALSPPKNKGGQRTYRPKDIKLLLAIRKLLYEDGFTIAGARKRLKQETEEHPDTGEELAGRRRGKPRPSPAPPRAPKERITQVRRELENILTLLDRE